MMVSREKKKDSAERYTGIRLNFKVIARKFATTSRGLGCQHLVNAGVNYSGQYRHSR